MELTRDFISAAEARGIRDELMRYLRANAGPGSDVDAATVIITELIGNVVRHAPGPVRTRVEWSDGHALLEIEDRGRGFELGPLAVPPLDAESGRGLFLVNALAKRFEVLRSSAGGALVRVWLPLQPASGLA